MGEGGTGRTWREGEGGRREGGRGRTGEGVGKADLYIYTSMSTPNTGALWSECERGSNAYM